MTKPTALSTLIRTALDQNGRNQQWLAGAMNLKPSQLSDQLNAKRPTSYEQVSKLAELLAIPYDVVLLARDATEAQREGQTPAAARALEAYSRLLGDATGRRRGHHRAYRSLEDFPFGSDRWNVIVGDRREGPPGGLGDLISNSVSSCDLMFLLRLRLPPESEIWSDKVIRTSPKVEEIKQLRANLLLIGSPAVSLVTREILRSQGATFMFNTRRNTFALEKNIIDKIAVADRHNPRRLAEIELQEGSHIRGILANYRKPGFVDPVDFRGIRGLATRRNNDYGVIALAPNPWSDSHVVCICAGIHGPGTAGAVQMLTDPANFEHHPWGGVLEVTVSDQALWEERFMYLNPNWDTKPYDPDVYFSDLDALRKATERGDDSTKDIEIPTLDAMRASAERIRKMAPSA